MKVIHVLDEISKKNISLFRVVQIISKYSFLDKKFKLASENNKDKESNVIVFKNSIKNSKRPKVTIGTMIETPRAALVAGELAEISDFFSFGTNDLTQMTFGFSRDDVESRMMPAYLEAGLLKRNPFETIDQVGVGELVQLAAKRGRKAKRGIKLGVCGEHGGDPESIGLFYRAGLDYVSCSPYRIPIARLASAQAIIGGSKAETK